MLEGVKEVFMTTESSTRKAGRPAIHIHWPDKVFTIASLFETTNLSSVTLYQKVHEAIENKVIEKIGSERTKHGRPRMLFRRVTATPTVASSTQEAVAP